MPCSTRLRKRVDTPTRSSSARRCHADGACEQRRAETRETVSPAHRRGETAAVAREGIEVYLYPADLLLRGEPRTLAHVRAAMTRTNLERDAYLVTLPEAQKMQDEIRRSGRSATTPQWARNSGGEDGARGALTSPRSRVDLV